MRIRGARGGAAAVITLALTAAASPAAHADAFRHRDALRDVVVQRTDNETGATSSEVDSRRTSPDLEQLTALHSRYVLSIATTIRALNEEDNAWISTVVTSTGDTFDLQRAIGADIGTTPKVLLSRNGERVYDCDGLHVSRTSSGVIAKIPTRCLGRPWKVRVGVQMIAADKRDRLELQDQDDVLRNGAFDFKRPSLSAWIAG